MMHATKANLLLKSSCLLLLSFCVSARAQSYTFTTLAGSPFFGSVAGSADGVGGAARFFGPQGVAVDRSGNVFVADTNNHTIRKIAPDGTVTTLAGTAGQSGYINFGYADGVGSAARFGEPASLAVDGNGNIFVADSDNYTIRAITPTGVVTTLAGVVGRQGSVDGAVSVATFGLPAGIAVDGNGNVYVADAINNTIRKITPAGLVTTWAGLVAPTGSVNWGSADGLGSAARFFSPEGVAVDGSGNVFVADTLNNTIRKITPDGMVTTIAGTANSVPVALDGTGSAARFNSPVGISVDGSGNLFVADSGSNTVRKIAPGGVVTTLAGLAGLPGSANGLGIAARFASPHGVAVDSNGNVFVADTGNNTIRKISPVGMVTTNAGPAGMQGSADGPGSAARFNNPSGLAADLAGNVFVADTGNFAIRKITPDGIVSTFAGSVGISGAADGVGSAAQFGSPNGVAVDSGGNVLVADGNGTIRMINPAGVVTTLAGAANRYGSADGLGPAARFADPVAITADGNGNLFVADFLNGIRKITANGSVTTLTDSTGNTFGGTTASGLAVDGADNIFLDSVPSQLANGSWITKITTGGVVATLAGLAEFGHGFNSYGSADGVGSAARFNLPQGLALSSGGNLYVADTGNATLRRISVGGVVTTIGGNAGTRGIADGTGSTALFTAPIALTVDNRGNIYVSDSGTIRKGVPQANPARLVNVSVLASLTSGGDSLTLGTVVSGAGATKPLLVRAVGPSLAPFGITNFLSDPKLGFFTGPIGVGQNDNWGGTTALTAVFAQVGAFPFVATTSSDAALYLPTVASGGNTVQVSGNGTAGGLVLAELYDTTSATVPTPNSPRLINVSVLKNVGNGLTGGFIVGGAGAETVIIRAVGPSLAAFGVTGILADPILELFDSGSHSIATNDNWSAAGSPTAAELNTAFASVGAFTLPNATSKDAALVVTLQPGNYTAQVRSADVTTGVVLLEVYEVP